MKKTETRIQKKNQSAIKAAGLKVFSQFGFRGSTLDQIATESGLSKPNILYYFSSKEAIYEALLAQLLTDWLQPVRDIDPEGEPVEEILNYAIHKMKMSRLYPRESRLYANEIIQGAPRIKSVLTCELRDVVQSLAQLISNWSEAGLIRVIDPYHLIFSIWAMTQHYADFDVQVQAILGDGDHFHDAEQYLEDMLRRMLTV
ncbi:TetR family transcriptional regulator C-terminal domain-containing protein [Planktomarina sp.]|jgi:TetR/AcrR family transcriptional regulator|nr:TetR family transcriptional regulator C-terminal domain-containing protein [Planktomarina sp.]MDB4841695.1 TetR family transcriptional regulator C-terminal domain-containing protein [Planktomarina sp.]